MSAIATLRDVHVPRPFVSGLSGSPKTCALSPALISILILSDSANEVERKAGSPKVSVAVRWRDLRRLQKVAGTRGGQWVTIWPQVFVLQLPKGSPVSAAWTDRNLVAGFGGRPTLPIGRTG